MLHRTTEMTRRDSRLTGELALLTLCLIWGCNFSVMKVALGELHPLAFNSIRITLSVVFLAIVHLATGAHRQRLPPGSWRKILGLGLLGNFAYQVLFMSGLARTSSGNAALLVASAPVFTFLLGRLLGERLGRSAWIGMFIAFTGTTCIALSRGVDLDDKLLLGNLLVLIAACAWGSYTVVNRGMSQAIPASTLALYCMGVVMPLHWLLGVPHLSPLWDWQISASSWLALFYSGILGTGLGLILFNVGLRRVGSAYTAGIISLVPVLALVVGALTLDEPVTTVKVVGGACVLGGVALLRRAQSGRQSAAASPPCPRNAS